MEKAFKRDKQGDILIPIDLNSDLSEIKLYRFASPRGIQRHLKHNGLRMALVEPYEVFDLHMLFSLHIATQPLLT